MGVATPPYLMTGACSPDDGRSAPEPYTNPDALPKVDVDWSDGLLQKATSGVAR